MFPQDSSNRIKSIAETQPRPLPKWGTVGPMSRCFGLQQAQVQGHQSRGRRNCKYLESAPLIQTISPPNIPQIKNGSWQDFSTKAQVQLFLPITSPLQCICPSFSYLYFYISLSSCALTLSPPLPSLPFSPSLKNTFLSGTENKLRLWVVMLI